MGVNVPCLLLARGEDQILVVEAVGKMSRGHDSASVLRRPDSFIWDRSLQRAEDG